MKTININLEDKEHQELKQKKGKLTWYELLLKGAEKL